MHGLRDRVEIPDDLHAEDAYRRGRPFYHRHAGHQPQDVAGRDGVLRYPARLRPGHLVPEPVHDLFVGTIVRSPLRIVFGRGRNLSLGRGQFLLVLHLRQKFGGLTLLFTLRRLCHDVSSAAWGREYNAAFARGLYSSSTPPHPSDFQSSVSSSPRSSRASTSRQSSSSLSHR